MMYPYYYLFIDAAICSEVVGNAQHRIKNGRPEMPASFYRPFLLGFGKNAVVFERLLLRHCERTKLAGDGRAADAHIRFTSLGHFVTNLGLKLRICRFQGFAVLVVKTLYLRIKIRDSKWL